MTTTSSLDLEDLLARARVADPTHRIELRDPIAAHGEPAIDAMAEWLADPRLAAFAIRVLERLAREPGHRGAVLAVLADADRAELAASVDADLDRAIASLAGPSTGRSGRRPAAPRAVDRPPGLPGEPGRGYWVMRTSQWERPYLWSEAQAGRLRQGWGVIDEQNLEVIADAIKHGNPLTEPQRDARRALRMLATWHDGMRLGDVVVAPNLPEYGALSIFRVAGSYEWSLAEPRQWGERFGHVLPVDLLVSQIDRRSPNVTDGLRAVRGVQTRLYNITGYGGDVERLIGGRSSSEPRGDLWTEPEYEALFGRFPPLNPRPSDADFEALAVEFGRTYDAVRWQWEDGATYCSSGSAFTTSDALKAWLDERRRFHVADSG